MRRLHDVTTLESATERQLASRRRTVVAGASLAVMAFMTGACHSNEAKSVKAPVVLTAPEAPTTVPVVTTIAEAPTTIASPTTTAPRPTTTTTMPRRNGMLTILEGLKQIQSGQQMSDVAQMDFLVQAGTAAQQDQNGHLVAVTLSGYRVAHPVLDKADNAICFEDVNSAAADCVPYSNLPSAQRLIVINPADQSEHYFNPSNPQDTATRTDTVIKDGGRLYVQNAAAPDSTDGRVLIAAGQPPLD